MSDYIRSLFQKRIWSGDYDNRLNKFELWQGSGLEYVSILPPATKGEISENVICTALRDKGLYIEKRDGSTQHDFLINRNKVELKFCMAIDRNFRFQQIEPNNDWEYILWFGVDLSENYFWFYSKEDILNLIKQNIITRQHQDSSYWYNGLLEKLPPCSYDIDGLIKVILVKIKDGKLCLL